MSTVPQPPASFPSERLAQVPPHAPASKRHNREVIPFRAADGFKLKLVHVWGDTPPTRGPVLLIHGAGVRSSIFEAPVETTVVDALVEHGYDVWLEDWRASIDHPPNRWTLDQAAVFDHPMAVREIVHQTGASEVKALTHCQGSTSFFMSAWAGLVPEVSVIVSNAVSLHTVIPTFSRFKIQVPLPVVAWFTDYLNPRWGIYAPTRIAKVIARVVEATHHECDNPVCHGVSFTYGSGFPALWSHAHLSEKTHEWLTGEFAHVPVTFFRQMARCVRRGSLVSVDRRSELPEDFERAEPRTDAVFALFAGDQNRCFLPVGQERTFDVLNQHHPGRHSFHRLENYGHLDVFMGNDAAKDVFPQMIAALDR
jgi:hypothetical protein